MATELIEPSSAERSGQHGESPRRQCDDRDLLALIPIRPENRNVPRSAWYYSPALLRHSSPWIERRAEASLIETLAIR